MSGAQRDQIAPTLAVDKKEINACGVLGNTATTLSPFFIPSRLNSLDNDAVLFFNSPHVKVSFPNVSEILDHHQEYQVKVYEYIR